MADRCEVCHFADGHSVFCPAPLSGDRLMQTAKRLYQLLENSREHTRMAHENRVFWQAKFHTLRLENNALRNKLYSNRDEVDRGE